MKFKAEIFQKFWDHRKKLFEHWKVKTECFLTSCRRFLRSNRLEQLKFKLEKIIGIEKPTGKVRRYSLLLDSCITFILPKWDLPFKVMLNTRNIPFGLKTKGVKKREKSFSSATSFLCGRWTEPKDSIVLPWSNTFSYSPAATVEKFWNIFICRKKIYGSFKEREGCVLPVFFPVDSPLFNKSTGIETGKSHFCAMCQDSPRVPKESIFLIVYDFRDDYFWIIR